MNPNVLARTLLYGAHRVNLQKGMWLVLKAAYKHWRSWFHPANAASPDNEEWLSMQNKMRRGWSPWLACAVRAPDSWIPSDYGAVPPEATYPNDRTTGKALIENTIRTMFDSVSEE